MTVTADAGIRAVLDKALAGERLSFDDGVALMQSPDLLSIGLAADAVRRRLHPDGQVTFVIDRNINYTNVCVADCTFCAFFRRAGDTEAYVLPTAEILHKVQELVDQGGTQILMQGGLNPNLGLDYYCDLLQAIKARFPAVACHAFSPPELAYLAKITKLPLKDLLRRLKEAGLDSIPGGGGEILVDRVRDVISVGKSRTDQWLQVMLTAQEVGLHTSATMMHSHLETVAERVEHLLRLREAQDVYGGFLAFINWDFQAGQTRLWQQMQAEDRHLGTGFDYLRVLAVSRLMLDNFKNIQASWVTQGAKLAQVALSFGANDFGGTMMEENVVSAAGTAHHVTPPEAVRLIRNAGFRPVQRDTWYNTIRTFD